MYQLLKDKKCNSRPIIKYPLKDCFSIMYFINIYFLTIGKKIDMKFEFRLLLGYFCKITIKTDIIINILAQNKLMSKYNIVI